MPFWDDSKSLIWKGNWPLLFWTEPATVSSKPVIEFDVYATAVTCYICDRQQGLVLFMQFRTCDKVTKIKQATHSQLCRMSVSENLHIKLNVLVEL